MKLHFIATSTKFKAQKTTARILFPDPDVIVVDLLDSIDRLPNQITMIQESEISIGIPKQIFVENPAFFYETEGLKFPVILKPLVANRSVDSHQMALVFNEGLKGYISVV
ncbi:inositol-tetrakisphosphate 1-kinase 1-like [Olea europaea subsp. europaea]|uniref:inositol-1,3,4-trisphosphate 5/6-kinase n=1 Tax=Olea europaea subsp. europaea TaxID=158383 RepID=A0A8S0T4W2_OLEEU|nr:inositol-tetrakisphosphate 1-kinase 1-like [Olea europaea subsp. europaea]